MKTINYKEKKNSWDSIIRLYSVLMVAILFFQASFGQEKENQQLQNPAQTLRGRVIDRESKAPLSFANVIVLNSDPQVGTTTNLDGYFKIENLPVGRYNLQVTYVGYENAVIPEILVGSAKEVVLTIEISESLENIDELIVSVKKGQALNEMAITSANSFSVEETKRYAASISDPARMVQSFAGVSTNDDASNEIVIRGNSPNWMLWKLEGVEIPSPNHFAEEGYTSGAVSILSTNMLGKSDFYTGAFSAEFGNALSGVFDLKFRNGNEEKREYSFQLGLLGAEFSTEGPFKKGYRGSYLLSYRYSTFSLMNNLNIEVSENALPNYQDLSFKVHLPTKKAGNFSLWGIGGLSDVDEKFLPDTSLNQKFEDGYSDYTKTGMFATGITHTYFPDSRSYVKTVISNSMSYNSETYDEMNRTGILENSFYDDLKSSAFRINSLYNRKISGKLTLRSGVTFSKLSYDYLSEETDSLGIWDTQIDGKGNSELYQGYVQSKYKFTDNIMFTAGMHYTHFALNNKNSFEPRLGLLFKLKNNQKIGLGYGHHTKIENLPTYFVEFENSDGSISYLNQDLELTGSVHYVLSYEKLLTGDLGFKTELYYQDISNLPVPNNPDKPLSPAFGGVNPNDTLVSSGVGKNYGTEFTLQKYFTNNYYFLVTNSIFESKYKPLNGKWYNTR